MPLKTVLVYSEVSNIYALLQFWRKKSLKEEEKLFVNDKNLFS